MFQRQLHRQRALRLTRLALAHKELVHRLHARLRVGDRVPDAVAREHQVLVLLVPVDDQHLRLRRHHLLLRRQRRVRLEREVAQSARHCQLAVHATRHDRAARRANALVLWLLRVKTDDKRHIVRLVIRAQGDGIAIAGENAARVTCA